MTRQRGFTLMEVMIGLALLGVALTVLIKSAGNSIFSARQAQMMGVATDLSRAKMYDIEEMLLKDGFTETDQSEGDIGEVEVNKQYDFAKREVVTTEELKGKRSGKCFEDEGWPNICYAYKVEQVELPSFEELQRMALGRAQGSGSAGSGSGSDGYEEPGGFENSALGGLLSMGGFMGGGTTGGAGGDVEDAQGASFLQGQYTMVQQVLKVSIRKVTLVVWWDVMGRERDLKTVAFFTDASAMDKVLMGLGSQDIEDQPAAGSGSGSRPGTGTGSSRPTTPGGTGSGRR
jgi:general secretion pathway protein I